LHAGVIARFKILSELKIDESRVPQDGRISQTIDGKPLDLRVSTLPTVHGEKIVMRIVDKSKKIPELWKL
jgi:type IV pilus assembly protein PilB